MAHRGCSLLLAYESRGENTFSVQHVMIASPISLALVLRFQDWLDLLV